MQSARPGTTLELVLNQVRYSQESIKGFFRDDRSISMMMKELVNGRKSFKDIPKMAVVMNREGTIYSADNRRLWTFKNSGMPHETRIPVVVGRWDDAFDRKLTTP